MTDAAGNTTSTAYSPYFDQPSVVTNALGNAAHYKYDVRGRKTAQYGTGAQPLIFAYDEANRMVSLTTFREDAGDITTDPTGRTDGDLTTWSYDDATGLLIRKTYADGTHEDTTYNALNLKSTLTDARGIVTTWGYNLKKGVNTSVSYSDSTPGIQYAYNYLNQLMRVTDASGTRTISYNQYSEPDTDSITIGGASYQLQENYDIYGRSSGYALKQGTTVLQEVSQGYEANGRLASAGIMHGGEEQTFAYSYLAGSSLLFSLAMPNGIVRELAYEEHRDLATAINYHLGETVPVSCTQSYDALGRPVTRTRQRGTEAARNDSFSYNGRNELTAATLGTAPYGYSYDNIGNRKTAQELAEELAYTANELNQYTRIEERGETPFVPTYDASGNQTLIKTSTGIWTAAYNAANRAVSFTSRDGATVVECGYDYQGRRYMKKVTVNGTVTSHERYLYRGYLQIAALDMLNSRNVLRTLLWDPLEPVVTRPLALVQDNALYCYGVDFNKNVTEVFDAQGTIAAAYDYSPYGQVASTGDLVQPVQWSSEMNDEELALVYYNYRYYNPADGRWINRDPVAEEGGWNLYAIVKNHIFLNSDRLGLEPKIEYDENCRDKRPNISKQFKIAQNAISKAIKDINPKSDRYVRFFGKYSRARHQVVNRVISEIKRILDHATISVDCCGIECDENWIAYVYNNDGKFQIFLCPEFFSSPGGNDFKNQANTILHELSHEVEMPQPNLVLDKQAPWNPNTEPSGAPYGDDYAEWIAEHDAWTAVTNAENYAAYLSENL